ncbi:MAG: hypothetical protein K0M78_15075, partial [Brevundimonas sp.]|nr:hypothetical protein [Brevundimonas sp.]
PPYPPPRRYPVGAPRAGGGAGWRYLARGGGPVWPGVRPGVASAVTESTAERGALKLTLRTDHPAFAASAAEGRLAAAVGEQRRTVEVPRPHLAKLRRFTELCSG